MRVLSFLLFSLTFSISANASVLQILHTNDLHGAMKTSGAPKSGESEFGGWAQIKAKMDQLTLDAQGKGIETIRLDAGDFLEGTANYFPDDATHVFSAFQDFHFDAVTLGNHDWMMGAHDMDALYGAHPSPFPFLSANLRIHPHLMSLRNQVRPHAQIIRGGVKVGILGLSTHESLYSWIPMVNSHRNDFLILNYQDQGSSLGIANQEIEVLSQENDLVIALTHIGLGEDRLLAQHSKNLDLVIGGHSHTTLESLALVQNQVGDEIPVVQSGFNGRYIGRIFVEVEPGKKARVLSYELVPVLMDGVKDDRQIAYLRDAESALDRAYGPHLRERIGKSEVRLVPGSQGRSAYSEFVTDALRESTGAEISLDVGEFHGNTIQPAGEVNRLTLMEMYPRKFEKERNQGLWVYTAETPGVAIQVGLEYALRFGIYLSLGGVSFDLGKLSDLEFESLRQQYAGRPEQISLTPYYPKNIKVLGQPILKWRWYSIATTEALIRGAFGITHLSALVFHHAYSTGHTVWDALSDHLRKIGVIRALGPSDRFNSLEIGQDDEERIHNQEIQDHYSEKEFRVAPWVRENPATREMINEGISKIIGEMK